MIKSIDVDGLKEDQVKLVQELVEFFRAKAEGTLGSQGGDTSQAPPEEEALLEMLEHDVVVPMPPLRKYTVTLDVKDIRKGTPVIVVPDALES